VQLLQQRAHSRLTVGAGLGEIGTATIATANTTTTTTTTKVTRAELM
jgi:hypothetical protein